MKNAVFAALAVALVTSTAAIAAPKDKSGTSDSEVGQYFNCIIPTLGPKGYRTGACWLDGAST